MVSIRSSEIMKWLVKTLAIGKVLETTEVGIRAWTHASSVDNIMMRN
jgi:hypothetical protein